MKDLNSYIEDLIKLESSLDEHLKKIVLSKSGVLLTRLKLRLWNLGVDGTGNLIQPEYTEETKSIKRRDGQRSSHVTLRDTGSFYKGMYVSFHNNEVEIFSSDYKEDLLTEKYGDAILELTTEEQDWFMATIIDDEVQRILDELNDDIEL